MAKFEAAKYKREDGQQIVADYYPGTKSRGIICLHQNSNDRKSYAQLAEILQNEGYHLLCPDFMGYGESDGDKSKFSENDYLSLFEDAMLADDYLRKIDPKMEVQMIGSSIGANTVLRFQEMNTLKSAVVISPSLNYYDIDPVDSNLSNIATPIFYINSEGDKWSAETRKLYEDSPLIEGSEKQIKIYPGPDHGVKIIYDNPQAMSDLLEWLNAH